MKTANTLFLLTAIGSYFLIRFLRSYDSPRGSPALLEGGGAADVGAGAVARRVLVAGAGGRTGGRVFRALLARPGYYDPVGTVRSDSSRQALVDGDGSDGAPPVPPDAVAVADITDDDASSVMEELLEGCDALVVATSAKPAPTGVVNEETGRPVLGFPNGRPELVDWIGQKHLIDAARRVNPDMHVVLCGSMGGTDPNNPLNDLGKVADADGIASGGDILKWKRKAEVYLIDSGLPYTIVHPGGLIDEPGSERELLLGVDDEFLESSTRSVPREDVANVMVAALENESYRGRSFDLVSKPAGEGVTTTDFSKLIESLGGKNCDYSLGEIP